MTRANGRGRGWRKSDPKTRFLEKLGVDEHGCWRWLTPTRSHDGYGLMKVDGRNRYAHVLAYEWWVGPVPAGLDLDHLCRIRDCVNPSHLEPVTRMENLRRGNNRESEKNQCPQGHPYDAGNTYWYPGARPHRACRVCVRSHQRASRERRQAVNG